MRFTLITNSPLPSLMRSLNYHPSRSGKVNSFERRITAAQPWPRFHIYAETTDRGIKLDLHLDQKAETRHYQPKHAHNAEHSGALVEAEADRIRTNR